PGCLTPVPELRSPAWTSTATRCGLFFSICNRGYKATGHDLLYSCRHPSDYIDNSPISKNTVRRQFSHTHPAHHINLIEIQSCRIISIQFHFWFNFIHRSITIITENLIVICSYVLDENGNCSEQNVENVRICTGCLE